MLSVCVAHLRTRKQGGKDITYVEWQTVIRYLDHYAPGWSCEVVATLVDPPPTKRVPISPLTPDEARDFLEGIKGDRFEALFAAALALGLRLGEALGLGWNDIDFEKRTLAVRYALQRIDKQLVRTDLKRDTSGRILPLPDHTLAVLQAHRANQLEEKLKAGRNWQDSELVFTTHKGNPLDGRNVLRHFQMSPVSTGKRVNLDLATVAVD